MKAIQTRKGRVLALLVAAGAFAICTTQSHAALSVTNGDFEADTTQTNDVTDWYDTVTVNTASWWESTWAGPYVSPNGTSVLGLSYNNGILNWAYQSIGVNDEAKSSIVVKFDVGSFTDAGGTRDMGVTFTIYESDGTFVPSNNVDIAFEDGITEIDSVSFGTGPLNPGEISTDRAVQLDLSTASTTGELFLRLENAVGLEGQPWLAVDNILLSDALPPFDISVSPAGAGATNPVILEVEIGDLGSKFDSVEMYFDGSQVTPDDIDTVSGVTTVTYDPGTLTPLSTHTGRVVVAGVDPIGYATNQWTFTTEGSLTFVSATPIGSASTEPILEVVIADAFSELDTTSIELYVNDIPVEIDNLYNNTPDIGQTTFNGKVDTPLESGVVQTGKVVYSAINPTAGPFTNTWTFSTSGDPGFGIYINDSTQPTPDGDDIYQFEFAMLDADNVGAGDDAASYVAHDRGAQGQGFTTASGSSWELTSIWVKHVEGYETYAQLDEGDAHTVRITDPAQSGTAGFEVYSETLSVITNIPGIPIVGMPLPSGTGNWVEYRLQTPVVLSPNKAYGFDIGAGNEGNEFYDLAGVNTNAYDGGAAYSSGSGGIGSDSINTTWAGDRTFLLKLAPSSGGGPTVDPDIHSIVVSDGTAMLTWDSETGVTYSIQNKTSLSSESWTSVKTGISGAGATTSDSVPLSGSDQEFFRIEGN